MSSITLYFEAENSQKRILRVLCECFRDIYSRKSLNVKHKSTRVREDNIHLKLISPSGKYS